MQHPNCNSHVLFLIIFFLCALFLISSTSYLIVRSDESLLNDPVYVLDQYQENESTEFSVHNKVILAQSFTPSKTPLTKIEVKIDKPRKTTTDLRLSVRDSLNGSDLLFVPINAEDIPYFTHWIEFDILDFDVNVGEKYYIILEANAPVSNSYRWRSVYDEETDNYDNGTLYRYFTTSGVWETVETDTDWVDSCFRTYSYESEVDLVCNGFLNWTNVTPAQDNLTGYFTVENEGTPFSRLDWKIVYWPGWGTWQFSQMNGTNLRPEDGGQQVNIQVEAPHSNVPDEYTGKIVIVNENDKNDTAEIQARLVTSKQKSNHHDLDVMESIFHLFQGKTNNKNINFSLLKILIRNFI